MSTPILYTARYLLPLSSPPLEDGALLVAGGRILAVARRQHLTAAHPRAAVVDFGEALLLPPLVNAHTHLELTDFPAWAAAQGENEDPAGFVEWIQRVIRVKRGRSQDDFADSLAAGIDQSLAAGTGAVGDILSRWSLLPGYRRQPLRGRLFLELLGLQPAGNQRQLQESSALLEQGPVGRLQLGLAPHAPYTLSAEFLHQITALARQRQWPATLHFAEAAAESAFLAESGGPLAEIFYPLVGWGALLPPPARCTPAQYLAAHGGLDPALLLVHGVQVGEADVAQLAAAGSSVVLCPRSNARLQVGRAPVELYRRYGVPLALGTDSRASCDSLSVWDELAFAATWFAGALTPAELLVMATQGGAKALGLEADLGQLRAGQGANFQVLRPAALPPAAELAEFLCSPGRSEEVAALYLDGAEVLQKADTVSILSNS